MKSMFPEHMDLTAKVMDFQLQRQNIVSSNLANLNTPGYKARRLEFEDELQSALGQSETGPVVKTHDKHMPAPFSLDSVTSSVTKSLMPRVIQGVDNVDLDTEMAIMAKNNLRYTTLSQVITRGFSGLKQTIQEGAK